MPFSISRMAQFGRMFFSLSREPRRAKSRAAHAQGAPSLAAGGRRRSWNKMDPLHMRSRVGGFGNQKHNINISLEDLASWSSCFLCIAHPTFLTLRRSAMFQESFRVSFRFSRLFSVPYSPAFLEICFIFGMCLLADSGACEQALLGCTTQSGSGAGADSCVDNARPGLALRRR